MLLWHFVKLTCDIRTPPPPNTHPTPTPSGHGPLPRYTPSLNGIHTHIRVHRFAGILVWNLYGDEIGHFEACNFYSKENREYFPKEQYVCGTVENTHTHTHTHMDQNLHETLFEQWCGSLLWMVT